MSWNVPGWIPGAPVKDGTPPCAMPFGKCLACMGELGTLRLAPRPHYPPATAPWQASALVSAILGSALRSRERRFESCWGRFVTTSENRL